MPANKYDYRGMVARAQARPGEWVLGLPNVPNQVRSRVRWRAVVELQDIPPTALSVLLVNRYQPDGKKTWYGDLWVRWNGQVRYEPPLAPPPHLARPSDGRERTGDTPKMIQSALWLHELVRDTAESAGVSMASLVNEVVEEIADPKNTYPNAAQTRSRTAALNSTVPDATWIKAKARAKSQGWAIGRLVKRELARKLGYNENGEKL